MGAERDRAGAPGAGLSGAGRDDAGLRAGTSGSSAMGDQGLGSAEVHSGLHGGSTGDPYAGLGFADSTVGGSDAGRLRDMGAEARDRAENVGGRARHFAEDLGHRASDAASTARERVSGLREKANRVLERRGVVDRMRENPLPVLGVAFAVGFLLAGGDDRTSDSRGARARRELRNALMAGLSAGIAQGARSFLNEAGNEGSGFLSMLIDSFTGESGGRGGASDAFDDAARERSTRGPAYASGGTRPPSHRESF
jgi:hypothetical protein